MSLHAAATTADARNRAWRTFVQGALIDIAAAVCVVLVPALTDLQWTKAYWGALGLLIAKTVIQSAVSYVARRLVPPANS